ncbi:MAG TPA: hypothetical protein PKD37_02260 [Oligoflexia bacterium]|nr:hypothetical protein [Oligoflexia bacterium]HMP26794.1 hypothetical protein [Oligoflexia bacterium]
MSLLLIDKPRYPYHRHSKHAPKLPETAHKQAKPKNFPVKALKRIIKEIKILNQSPNKIENCEDLIKDSLIPLALKILSSNFTPERFKLVSLFIKSSESLLTRQQDLDLSKTNHQVVFLNLIKILKADLLIKQARELATIPIDQTRLAQKAFEVIDLFIKPKDRSTLLSNLPNHIRTIAQSKMLSILTACSKIEKKEQTSDQHILIETSRDRLAKLLIEKLEKKQLKARHALCAIESLAIHYLNRQIMGLQLERSFAKLKPQRDLLFRILRDGIKICSTRKKENKRLPQGIVLADLLRLQAIAINCALQLGDKKLAYKFSALLIQSFKNKNYGISSLNVCKQELTLAHRLLREKALNLGKNRSATNHQAAIDFLSNKTSLRAEGFNKQQLDCWLRGETNAKSFTLISRTQENFFNLPSFLECRQKLILLVEASKDLSHGHKPLRRLKVLKQFNAYNLWEQRELAYLGKVLFKNLYKQIKESTKIDESLKASFYVEILESLKAIQQPSFNYSGLPHTPPTITKKYEEKIKKRIYQLLSKILNTSAWFQHNSSDQIAYMLEDCHWTIKKDILDYSDLDQEEDGGLITIDKSNSDVDSEGVFFLPEEKKLYQLQELLIERAKDFIKEPKADDASFDSLSRVYQILIVNANDNRKYNKFHKLSYDLELLGYQRFYDGEKSLSTMAIILDAIENQFISLKSKKSSLQQRKTRIKETILRAKRFLEKEENMIFKTEAQLKKLSVENLRNLSYVLRCYRKFLTLLNPKNQIDLYNCKSYALARHQKLVKKYLQIKTKKISNRNRPEQD